MKSAKPSTKSPKPITRLSGVKPLGRLKRYFSVPDFKLGGRYPIGDEARYEFGADNGTTLESLGAEPLRTAYIAVGTPQRDEQGRITNAVIVSSYYAGDAAWGYYYWYEGQDGNDFALGPIVGPGRIIDTDRYYVVFLDALGLWGASKPSDGLGLKFPRYSLFDCVQANYRLLKDELNIGKVALATGFSMGAIQSYAWALLHPDYVAAIMPIGGSASTKTDPVLRWLFGLMTAAMESDPVWRATSGEYYHLPKKQHPNQGMMFGWSILLHTGLDLDFRVEQGWEEARKEVFAWTPERNQGALLREKGRDYDVNDLLVRNSSQSLFDVDEFLSRIKARTLVVHVKNDLWLRASLAEKSAARIPGARYVAFDNPLAHYAVVRAPNVVREEVMAFLKELE